MNRVVVDILGYGVDTFNFDDAVDYIMQNQGQIITINPEMIECANKNPDFKHIIDNAEMVVADGIGIKIGLKLLGHNVSRIPGIDLGKTLLIRASQKDMSVALIGASQDVIENAVINLKSEIRNLNIVYYHNGYFSEDEEIITDLCNKNPNLVLVALGSPKQEFFINKLKSHLPASIMIGLGGSFDVWAGKVKRAPLIFRKLGIEWLYRTLSEPQRFKRIFPTLPVFLFKVIKERLSNK